MALAAITMATAMAERTRYPDFVSIGPGSVAGRFLRMFWQPVYEAARLQPGRGVPLRVLGEDFTLYRGRSGKPFVVDARCAHRGALLSIGRIEGDHIACLYHGWTYDGTGQCVAQPAEQRGFAASVRIRSFPAQEYLGFVFAFFGEGEPPPFPRVLAAEGEGLLEVRESRRPYPYFSQLENSVDEVHFNFAHRRSTFTDVGLNDAIPEVDSEETDYGLIRYGKRPDAVRISHILMPNCLFARVHDEMLGWTEHFSWRVPIDDDTHSSFVAKRSFLTRADEIAAYRARREQQRVALKGLEPADGVADRILRGELHIDELPDRPDQVAIQDLVVLRSQGTRPARDKDLLAASDKQIRLLRQIYARELAAVADGRPIKQWRVPPDLQTSSGLSD